MSLSSDISTTSTALNNIKQAIIAKGVTPSGNITTYATAISQISGGGGVTLTRIKDDSNNEIGTYFMDFEDGNGNTYKVVLLDAQYRLAQAQWCTASSGVTNMPLYANLKLSNVWEARETATTNTQLILDYCTAGGYTSTACSHCRSQSFTINGTTYYGQLPNLEEVTHLVMHYNEFDSLDTSASTHDSTNFSLARDIWSSSQYNTSNGWRLTTLCTARNSTKPSYSCACPVLEIPV